MFPCRSVVHSSLSWPPRWGVTASPARTVPASRAPMVAVRKDRHTRRNSPRPIWKHLETALRPECARPRPVAPQPWRRRSAATSIFKNARPTRCQLQPLPPQPSNHPTIQPSNHPTIHQSTNPPIHQSINPSTPTMARAARTRPQGPRGGSPPAPRHPSLF